MAEFQMSLMDRQRIARDTMAFWFAKDLDCLTLFALAFGWPVAEKRRFVMARLKTPNGHSDWRAHLGRTREGGSLLEVDDWIPSEVTAISPLINRLMRLIEGSHCITGEEHAVQLALREALNNAVVHGNRLDARKLVHVRCRCKVGEGISLIVSDQGQGFDPRTAPDSVTAENLLADHGRGIHLMKLAMNEVSFCTGRHRGSHVQEAS